MSIPPPEARLQQVRLSRGEFLRVAAAGTVVASCGGLLSSCGGALSDQLSVSPGRVLPDKPFVVRLEGLSSGQRAVLSASVRDEEGSEWSSSATFKADEQGLVDISEQAPVSGSYDIKDPMGLVWSMTGQSRLFVPSLRPEAVRVSAEVGQERGHRSRALTTGW